MAVRSASVRACRVGRAVCVEHTKVALGVKPRNVVPVRISTLFQFFVVASNIGCAIVVKWANESIKSVDPPRAKTN